MNFYIKSFLIFSRIGLFTIGGGYAMVPLIEADLVDKRKWISKEDFLDLMALAQTVPGIFAVNIAIFIGYKIRGFWGAFWMALGTVLPSFVIMLLIALFFRQLQHLDTVERIFKGIRGKVGTHQPLQHLDSGCFCLVYLVVGIFAYLRNHSFRIGRLPVWGV